MAWTGTSLGRYAVRVSPVSLRRGAWAPVTISGPTPGAGAAARSGASATATRASGPAEARRATSAGAVDAVLADLVPGPHAEALALWSAAPRLPGGGPNPRRRAILAARGHYAGAGEVAFAAPEAVAPAGPNGTPAAAVDPQTGRALAAWVTLAGGANSSRIAYALRAAGPASAPAPVAAIAQGSRRGAGVGIATVLGVLALAVAGAFAGRLAIRRGAGGLRGCTRVRRG